jgi:hypothetical protein
MLSKMIHNTGLPLLCIVVVASCFALQACNGKEEISQQEALTLAQAALVEYAAKTSSRISDYAEPRVLRNESAGVWEFYFLSKSAETAGVNILVDRFKRTEIHPIPIQKK